MIALICPNCGGPLPSDAASMPRATCGYCSVTLSRASNEFEKVDGSGAKDADDLPNPRIGFHEAMKQGITEEGRDARHVLETALREHYRLASEAEVVADVCMGLAAEFEEDTGIDVSRDAIAIGRFAEGYLSARRDLSKSGSAELNLPFLAADERGPKHFTRRITIPDIQALARGERAPTRPAPPARSPAAQPEAAPPPQKKWWWPF